MKTRVRAVRRGPVVLLAVALAAAVACDDDGAGQPGGGGADVAGGGDGATSGDAASGDAGGGDGGGDAGGGDGGSGDASGTTSLTACGAAFAPGALDGLGGSLTAVGNSCADTATVVALANLSPVSMVVLTAADEAGAGVFRAVRLRDLSADAPTSDVLAESSVDGSLEAFEVFPSPFLVLDRDGNLAAWGSTSAGAGAPGEVVSATLGGADAPFTVTAPGNYGAAVLDDGKLLVNGLGAGAANEGPGLYLVSWDQAGQPTGVKVATNMGSASGAVVVRDDVVLAGGFEGFGTTWPDGGEGNRVFVLSLTALYGAATSGQPVDVLATATTVDVPSDFAKSGDGRLVVKRYDESYALAGIDAVAWTEQGGVVTIGETTPLTTGATFKAAALLSEDHWVLVHDGGYLTAEEGGE